MKGKQKNKFSKIQPKTTAKQNGTIEEFLYMVPKEITVRELERALTSYPEDKKEIWVELDMMEVILESDSLVFEHMTDTFDTEGDRAFLDKHGVKVVYAFNYNTNDKEAVVHVLTELHNVFGGFIASDTEDLEPIYEVNEFLSVK